MGILSDVVKQVVEEDPDGIGNSLVLTADEVLGMFLISTKVLGGCNSLRGQQ